jgi:hypothetical protein
MTVDWNSGYRVGELASKPRTAPLCYWLRLRGASKTQTDEEAILWVKTARYLSVTLYTQLIFSAQVNLLSQLKYWTRM